MSPLADQERLPMRVVDRDEFNRITCTRCGDCCKSMYVDRDIHTQAAAIHAGTGTLSGATREETLAELDTLEDMLVQIGSFPDGSPRYRCRHFRRDADGLGVCGIYAERPRMCRDFPYGRPVLDWPRCARHVRLLRRPLPLAVAERDG